MGRVLLASVPLYAEVLRRYAMRKMRDLDVADDLVQESLTRACVAIDGGREIGNLRAYLFAILNNLFADELLRRRRAGRFVSADDEAEALVSPPPQTERLECRDLLSALQRLPARQKEIVVLIGLDGLSYQTAADALGIPIGTVMSRLSRGRIALRRMLEGTMRETGRERARKMVERGAVAT